MVGRLTDELCSSSRLFAVSFTTFLVQILFNESITAALSVLKSFSNNNRLELG